VCDDGKDDGDGCEVGCKGVNPLYKCSGGDLYYPSTCSPICGDSKVVNASDWCDDEVFNDSIGCNSACNGAI